MYLREETTFFSFEFTPFYSFFFIVQMKKQPLIAAYSSIYIYFFPLPGNIYIYIFPLPRKTTSTTLNFPMVFSLCCASDD